jgi:hypothetical protein
MVTDVGIAGETLTVIEFEVAVGCVIHCKDVDMITLTRSPSFKVFVVKMALFDPAFTPFTFH